ncbi:MAG: Holliday junction branch migration protein RuvA [Patescibacteria group bacterium]|nr:Holliday junction branch migration protein RuvA [Patescibacteria group bacterium]
MIGFLSGKIINKGKDKIIIDVGGVGYVVYLTELGMEQCNDEDDINISIYTHVREQEITLYGFLQSEEQEMFELLISVSGIGPKAGLKILAVADVQTIILAIANEDISILTKVSGIGPKIAKKVVNELSGKVVAPVDSAVGDALAQSDAIDALRSMGYTVAEARGAIGDAPKEMTDVGEIVKFALKNLGK